LFGEWASLAEDLRDSPYEERVLLLDALDRLCLNVDAYPEDLKETIRASVEMLEGSSQFEHLRRVVGSWDYILRASREALGREHTTVEQLAEHAITDFSLYVSQLDWLLGGDAHQAFAFGEALGMRDEGGTWIKVLVEQWLQKPKDDRFIGGYFRGAKQLRGEEWLEKILDTWADTPALGTLVGLVTWRAIATDRAARRLGTLMRRGQIPAEFLGTLVYGFWAKELNVDTVVGLVDSTIHDVSAGAAIARLAFIAQYVKERPAAAAPMREYSFASLERAAGHLEGSMDVFYWKEVAESLVGEAPVEVCRAAIVALVASGESSMAVQDDARRILGLALREGGWPVFEQVLGPALGEFPQLSLILAGVSGETTPIADVDPTKLMGWIGEDPESRARMIANLTATRGEGLHSLTRAVLENWGHDTRVRAVIHARLRSGSWSGSAVNYLSELRAYAESLVDDDNINVRLWAREVLDELMLDIARESLEEEERAR